MTSPSNVLDQTDKPLIVVSATQQNLINISNELDRREVSKANDQGVSYTPDYIQNAALHQKVQSLEADVQRFTKAYRSEWPRPIDYANLIEAQYALRALRVLLKPIPRQKFNVAVGET